MEKSKVFLFAKIYSYHTPPQILFWLISRPNVIESYVEFVSANLTSGTDRNMLVWYIEVQDLTNHAKFSV